MATGGSIYERLRRRPDIEYDPHIAHAALIYDDVYAQHLADVHREYIAVAKRHGLPMLMGTGTWKASPVRLARSAFSERPVSRDNVVFSRELAESESCPATPIFVAGFLGFSGDSYRPEQSLSVEEAARFHGPQAEALADGGADVLLAATLPAVAEARGLARAMEATGAPYLLSFVVQDDGTVLDGTPIAEAVDRIDQEMTRTPLGYFVNCVHPLVVEAAFAACGESVAGRFIGFRANTSTLRPKDLDGRADLVTEDPATLANHMARVHSSLGIKIIGGCCGTNTLHIDAMMTACTERK